MRRLRRPLLITGAIVVSMLAVLGVEIQLARTGEDLDDTEGERPERLSVHGADGPALHVVWLGDSTTTGVGVDDFSDSMAARSARAVGDELATAVELTVLGRSGAQVHEVVDDQLPLLDEARPDLVVVSVGANDVTHLTGRSTFRRRFDDLLDGIASATPEAEIVVVGVPDMGSAPRFAQPLRWVVGTRGEQINGEVRGAARERGILYVDLAGQTGGIFRSDASRYFSADGFHPSSDGHGVWAEAITPALVTAARTTIS